MANGNYDLGVFYMPFWLYPGSNPLDGNWKLIDDYDTFLVNKGLAHMARIPMANYPPSPVWYDEKMGSVTEKQMELMNSHGLDFVVFDSFWGYVPTSDVY